MELLKLIIIDDEPILLKGLVQTYDWESMGFEVVGTARSGEQGLKMICEKKPNVVLTDIRMKQMTGLQVIEEIQKEDQNCLFIVLSAYRNFEYAQQACELGAFAYLLKPIEDDKLTEIMKKAYKTCMQQMKSEARIESWEKLLVKESDSFVQAVVQKYVQNSMPQEKVQEVFDTLQNVITDKDLFITLCVDIDVTYKITNSLDYEASRLTLMKRLKKAIDQKCSYWSFENSEGHYIFIIKTQDEAAVWKMKHLLEYIKQEEKSPVIAAISNAHKEIKGIKQSYEEAGQLFELASISGASAFTFPDGVKVHKEKKYLEDNEMMIVNAVRKNDKKELKQAFITFIYSLPDEEELQCQYLHSIMLKAELMIKDSYGMKQELMEKFQNYYSSLKQLNAARAVDVCYKILQSAIDMRSENASKDEVRYFKEYMSVAVAYIEEHLQDETLSIVSVASHIYLNPVYFGRVFKNTFHMTFKKYLLKQRMEKAKRLMEEGKVSIGTICEQVGISNPSYFSHLFKLYTGKMPSEYKKEYES